ncbi:MAG: protein kinase [Gemmatimonas sp.]|nr:protein kinase [Gemmatimonas sp.]
MFGLEGLLTDRTLLDRYRVGEVLGRGGMGVVYRAHDAKLRRDVALKVLTPQSPDPEAHGQLRSRLAREARIAAGIQHPNVVAVYDCGTDPSLRLDFLTMELLEGEDLATRLRRVGFPRLDSALAALREAAAGVAAGHRAGLVHRDVKPGNLFMAVNSDGGTCVKVLDFGIAQGVIDGDLTLTYALAGTAEPLSPAFASPEQLRGRETLTPASDVFSLGAVAYNLFTGRRLFRAMDGEHTVLEIEESLSRLRRRHSLPPPVMELLERALAPFPEDRFADAGALLRAIETDTRGFVRRARVAAQPTSSRPRPTDSRTRLRRWSNDALTLILLATWIFGANAGTVDVRAALGSLAISALLTPWLAGRLMFSTGSLRFSILATLSITLLALVPLEAEVASAAGFSIVALIQLLMASLSSWLSSSLRGVQEPEPEAASLPTDAW